MKRLAICLLAFALACGGDSTGPKAGSVTGIYGDNGSALTGGALPIGFTVLGASGFPVRGVPVTWTVAPTASAAVSPATQTSDSTGVVAAVVNVGTSIGAFTVTATVSGVAPIAFHLTALDPCRYMAPYALGDTVSAALTRTSCRIAAGVSHYYYNFYKLDLPPGQNSIRINEASSGANKIDPYVEVYRSTGELIGWNDDIQPGVIQTSQFDVILGDGGSFVIGATSYDPDTVGPYTLTSRVRPTTLAGCQDVWMTPGATIVDTIKTTDCHDSTSHYSDIIYMYMQAAQVIKVAERSTVVNPLLRLFNANFQLQRFDSVAANDDSSAGNPNAYISYAVPANGWYLLQIATAAANDTGEYTLAFSASTTGPSAPRSSALERVLPILPQGTFRGWKRRLGLRPNS
jgi:hypothetical protein